MLRAIVLRGQRLTASTLGIQANAAGHTSGGVVDMHSERLGALLDTEAERLVEQVSEASSWVPSSHITAETAQTGAA